MKKEQICLGNRVKKMKEPVIAFNREPRETSGDQGPPGYEPRPSVWHCIPCILLIEFTKAPLEMKSQIVPCVASLFPEGHV
jgi:hypothetical protein